MATEDKYAPTRVEDALDWGKLITGLLVAGFGVFTSALTIKHTVDKINLKRNDPDRYWDRENKRGCNSAHVIADSLHHVSDSLNHVADAIIK